MSRFTICCGGTGGHLAPGIAVAQRLVAAGHEPTLVVSRKQVDARLTERYPELKTISAPGEGWTGRPVQLPGFAFGQARLLAFALRHLRQSGSEGVLAFGGFLTGGFALAARVLGLPLVVHEANQIPGRSIRRAARWADTIWLPPGASDSGIVSERVRRCGMPLREEFQPMATEEARRRLSLPEQGPLLLVAGGSQGARALNEWADAQRQVLADAGVHCLCLGGLASTPVEAVSDKGTVFRRVRFCDDMPAALSAATLAVARAGAGSIAELARCRLPAFLVPFPFAADDHQDANARRADLDGGFCRWPQVRLEELAESVYEMLADEVALAAARERTRALDDPSAADSLVSDLLAQRRESVIPATRMANGRT